MHIRGRDYMFPSPPAPTGFPIPTSFPCNWPKPKRCSTGSGLGKPCGLSCPTPTAEIKNSCTTPKLLEAPIFWLSLGRLRAPKVHESLAVTPSACSHIYIYIYVLYIYMYTSILTCIRTYSHKYTDTRAHMYIYICI